MSHYKSNVRDQEFNLFEVFGLDKVLGDGAYTDIDAETARDMLGEMAKLAAGPVAESFADADRNPPVFDPKTHTVALPESFKKSMRVLLDGGWDKVGVLEELGGMPMPRALQWALIEHILGAGRTKAVQQADGTWHIDGVKRFITSGDSDDLFENIMHLVLARPEGAGPGTKGLSLFFVPKYHFDPETGELGERNGVYVTNVEHKMGLKVSATCELSLGQHDKPARDR